jgi:hypothetical protein
MRTLDHELQPFLADFAAAASSQVRILLLISPT